MESLSLFLLKIISIVKIWNQKQVLKKRFIWCWCNIWWFDVNIIQRRWKYHQTFGERKDWFGTITEILPIFNFTNKEFKWLKIKQTIILIKLTDGLIILAIEKRFGQSKTTREEQIEKQRFVILYSNSPQNCYCNKEIWAHSVIASIPGTSIRKQEN